MGEFPGNPLPYAHELTIGQANVMETSALYAASATCGVRSVWFGHVSDCLGGSEWEEWTAIEDMTAMSAKLGLEMLIQMHSRDSGGNDEA